MKRAYLLMHLAVLLWGLTGILGKAINMSEGMIVWYRLIISSAGLLPMLIKNRHEFLSRREYSRIAVVGSIVMAHWILFYASIKASNVSIALSCFSSVSLFTALLGPLSRKQKPETAEILLSLMVIGGLLLIFSVEQFYLTGILLAVGSAFLGALFTVLNKKLTEQHPAEVITFYELFTGFIILSLLLPAYLKFSGTSFQVPSITDSIYLILLGLLCTSLAFTISLKALKKLDAFTLNLTVNLEPLYSILLAFFIFGERQIYNPGFIAGTCIILLSVAVHSWYKWKIRPVTKTRENVL
jgi:drug/metabolite transporter (DMT)-like permease